jgi:hypothetical protein
MARNIPAKKTTALPEGASNNYFEDVKGKYICQLLNDEASGLNAFLETDDTILVPFNSNILFVGPGGIGKSMMMANLSIATESGGKALGMKVAHTDFALVSGEGGEALLRERIRTMTKNIDFSKTINNIYGVRGSCTSYLDRAFKIDTANGFRMLWDLVSCHGFQGSVVCLDPLIRFHSGDENSSKDMGLILSRLDQISKNFRMTWLITHHTPKNAPTQPRGSGVLYDWADLVISVSPARGNLVKLQFMKCRHCTPPAPILLRLNPDTLWYEKVGSDEAVPAGCFDICTAIEESDDHLSETDLVKVVSNSIAKEGGRSDSMKKKVKRWVKNAIGRNFIQYTDSKQKSVSLSGKGRKLLESGQNGEEID